MGWDLGARLPGSDPVSLCVLEEVVVSLIFLLLNKVEMELCSWNIVSALGQNMWTKFSNRRHGMQQFSVFTWPVCHRSEYSHLNMSVPPSALSQTHSC